MRAARWNGRIATGPHASKQGPEVTISVMTHVRGLTAEEDAALAEALNLVESQPSEDRHIVGGVVEVAGGGLDGAAGCGAAGGAGADQVLERAAGGVAVLAVPVIARSLGDRGEGDVQRAQQPGQLRLLVFTGRG